MPVPLGHPCCDDVQHSIDRHADIPVSALQTRLEEADNGEDVVQLGVEAVVLKEAPEPLLFHQKSVDQIGVFVDPGRQ